MVEQNKFSKKMLRSVEIEPRTPLLPNLVVHSLPININWQVLGEGYLTSLLCVHELTFELKSIECDHISILKVSALQTMQVGSAR